jgi:2-oxoisovalerate dehydrogenase E2 component (dihydrolipoyl transacylase)
MATLNNVDDEQDRLRIPSVGSNFSSYYDKDAKNEASIIESSHAATKKVLTSPAVRKLGKENDIDLSTVLGTGPGGRILKADVLKIIGGTTAISSPSSAQATSNTSAKLPPISSPSISEDTTIPLRGYNRLMVKSMTSSLSIPHMVYADEVNVNSLTSIRDSLRPLAKQMGVEKLTYMPFFVKAASLAMNEYPVLNSTIDVESMTLTYHAEHNVGIAVDTERGLAVPVVRGCQEKSVLDIALELGRLYSLVRCLSRIVNFFILFAYIVSSYSVVYQAAVGNLSEEDIANPTFTLSNIGAIGGTYMSPVVLPPQVAIGGE